MYVILLIILLLDANYTYGISYVKILLGNIYVAF